MRKGEEECKKGDRRANISLGCLLMTAPVRESSLGISKPQTITVKPGRHSPLFPLSLLLIFSSSLFHSAYNFYFILF